MYLFSNPPVRLYNVFVSCRLSDEELLQCPEFPQQRIKPNAPSECLSRKNMVLPLAVEFKRDRTRLK